MTTFDRFRLRATQDDILRQRSEDAQRNDPWILKSMLPNHLEVYHEPYLSGRQFHLVTLKPYEQIQYPPDRFSTRDQLFVYIKGEDGKLNLFLEPYTMWNIWKYVQIGTAGYRSTDGHLQVQASNWDLRGIMLHNKIRAPLDVYYKGNLVAQMYAYDGMTYLGGSAASVYFDNDREGLNFGDEISFRYSLPGEKGKFLYKIIIDDTQTQDVHIGDITGGVRGPDADNAVYRVDQPTYTGVPFYRPIGRYNSEETYSLQTLGALYPF